MTALSRKSLAVRVRWCAVAVALLALLAYGAAVAGEYVFDDVHSVMANPPVQDARNIASYWVDPGAFSRGIGKMYRPALLTSFALNWSISGAPWCLKAGNVLLHAAVAALLFAWLWRLSRRLAAAAIVAALFAVHPLASEAINLVSARSELLCAVGLLIGLLAHLRCLRGGGMATAQLGMVTGAVLACGSKETGVVLPLLCIAQAWCRRHAGPDRRQWRRVAAALLPMLAVVAVYLVARKLLLGQVAVPLLGRDGADPISGHGRSLAVQLATMAAVLPNALLHAVVPAGLTVDPIVVFRTSWLDPFVLLGACSVLGLTVAAAWPGPTARLRRLGVALAWLVAAPWIVVPLNMPYAEHRMYAPLIGLAAIAVAIAPALRAALRRLRVPVRLSHAAVAAAVLLGIVGSVNRSLLYRDERVLWRDALAANPASFRGWWGLGASTIRHGDVPGAIVPLARAHALYPAHLDAHMNFTEALVSLPDDVAWPGRSLVIAEQLAASSPGDPWVRTLHAQACLQVGRLLGDRDAFATAERLALSCLQHAEPKAYVYRLAACARRGLGDLDGAVAHLDTSIARGLAPVGLRIERAALLRELGRTADARLELMRAQQQAPMDPAVMHALQSFSAPPK